MVLSLYHEIFRSFYHWQKWCPCKRSRSEVKSQDPRGQNPNWPFLDCNSSLNSHMMMKWCKKLDVAYEGCPIVFHGHLSNFKFTRLKQIVVFDPNWVLPDCNSGLNSPMAMKWCTKFKVAKRRCPIVFQDHLSNLKVTRDKKNNWFWPKLCISGL